MPEFLGRFDLGGALWPFDNVYTFSADLDYISIASYDDLHLGFLIESTHADYNRIMAVLPLSISLQKPVCFISNLSALEALKKLRDQNLIK